MTRASLYTARQAATAIVAAARRFDVDPEEIAVGRSRYARQSQSVTRARKAVVIALSAETGGPVSRIGVALGWHRTAALSSVNHAPSNLPGGTFNADVAAVRAALRGEADTPPPPAAPVSNPIPKGASGTARKAPGTALSGAVEPLSACQGQGDIRPAGRGNTASSARSTPSSGEGRCRSAGESAAHKKPKPTADYSKLTPAQIAEHEMCEALLRDADRSEGQRAYAGALARQSLRGVV